MKSTPLAMLRAVALCLTCSALAGLLISAAISIHYRKILPTFPVLAEFRMTPRNITGVIVFLTEGEERQLNHVEVVSAATLLAGLALSVLYMERRSTLCPDPVGNDHRYGALQS